jgi:signal transduction histidine kinase
MTASRPDHAGTSAETTSEVSTNPLPAVSCPLLTQAIREVEAEIAPDGARTAEGAITTRLLAAVALAISQRFPAYVLGLVPRPRLPHCQQVIRALQSALVRAWSSGSTHAPPLRVLRYLVTLDRLEHMLQAEAVEQLGAALAGPDAPERLAEIVHDLRSPLTSILLLAETLRQGRSGPVTDAQDRQLGLIYSAALGLDSLSSDVLALARGNDPAADEQLTTFSIMDLLESVRAIVRPIAEVKGLAVLLHAAEIDHRLGRPTAVRRALVNLTTNALKFTHEGWVELRATDLGPDRVVFSVRDTGPGIAADAEATLFMPFRRTASPERRLFSSTGLGLAVTTRVVEALGGTLKYESVPNQGTCFSFEIVAPPATSRTPDTTRPRAVPAPHIPAAARSQRTAIPPEDETATDLIQHT